MSSPLSWVIQISIKPGQRDTFTQLMHEMVADTKNNQPGTHTYEWFIGDDGATVHIYERYADSDAAISGRTMPSG